MHGCKRCTVKGIHAYKMHAYKMYAYKMHAYKRYTPVRDPYL
jgi:hypothetical protein